MKLFSKQRALAGMRFLSMFVFSMIIFTVVAAASSKNTQDATRDGGYAALLSLAAIGFGLVKFKELKIDDGFFSEKTSKEKGYVAALEDLYEKEAGEQSAYSGLSEFEIYLKRAKLRREGKELPLTALAKQFMFHGVKVYGTYSDKVEKFFSTSGVTALFPIYTADRIMAGLMMSAPISDFIFAETAIEGSNVFEKVKLTDSEDKRKTTKTSEGAEFKETTITHSKETTRLKEYGRILTASYDAMKFQRLNVFAKFLERVGAQIAIDEFDELIYTLINGDGNSNGITSGRTFSVASAGSIGLADIIGFSRFATEPYRIDKIVGKKAGLVKWMTTLASMNAPRDQFEFIGMSLPKMFEWDRSVITDTHMWGVDSRYAIEKLSGGPVLLETDKIIRRKIEEAVISKKTGYSIWDVNAIYKFDY